jgi:hypothetical protein
MRLAVISGLSMVVLWPGGRSKSAVERYCRWFFGLAPLVLGLAAIVGVDHFSTFDECNLSRPCPVFQATPSLLYGVQPSV